MIDPSPQTPAQSIGHTLQTCPRSPMCFYILSVHWPTPMISQIILVTDNWKPSAKCCSLHSQFSNGFWFFYGNAQQIMVHIINILAQIPYKCGHKWIIIIDTWYLPWRFCTVKVRIWWWMMAIVLNWDPETSWQSWSLYYQDVSHMFWLSMGGFPASMLKLMEFTSILITELFWNKVQVDLSSCFVADLVLSAHYTASNKYDLPWHQTLSHKDIQGSANERQYLMSFCLVSYMERVANEVIGQLNQRVVGMLHYYEY